MSVRMRHTRGHTRNRRSHHALSATKTVRDKESGALRLPHRLDETTGKYRGRQIANPKVEKIKTKREKHGPEPKLPRGDKHAAHEHAEQTAARADVGKITEPSRPRSRSGTGS